MALPALKVELEDPVAERVARLEANYEHMCSDISDIKTDVRRLNEKMDFLTTDLTGKINAADQKQTGKLEAVDQKLTDKIEALDQKLTTKIDAVDQKLTGKIEALGEKLTAKIETIDQKQTTKIDFVLQAVMDLKIGRALDRVWWLLMSGALLGIMARAFKWI